MDRREFLSLSAGTCLIGGCSSQSDGADAPTSPTARDVDAIAHEQLIGAHYYHWYNREENWTKWTATPPVLGNYDSRDEVVINQHIKWALEHGINWFSISWWGPDTGTRVRPPEQGYDIPNGFLRASLANRIQFSILYESVGRFDRLEDGGFDLDDEGNRNRLNSDFKYLQNMLFNRDNYLRIDDRPVIFLYVARNFQGDVAAAFEAARNSIEDDPYLIADVIGPSPESFESQFFEGFDAVSLYSPIIVAEDSYLVAADNELMGLESLVPKVLDTYRTWQRFCQEHDLDFIPALLPGFDTRQNQRREFNLFVGRSSDAFEAFARGVREFMDNDLRALLITSWNEWPEDTGIEPGEAYGSTYLELIKSNIAVRTP